MFESENKTLIKEGVTHFLELYELKPLPWSPELTEVTASQPLQSAPPEHGVKARLCHVCLSSHGQAVRLGSAWLGLGEKGRVSAVMECGREFQRACESGRRVRQALAREEEVQREEHCSSELGCGGWAGYRAGGGSCSEAARSRFCFRVGASRSLVCLGLNFGSLCLHLLSAGITRSPPHPICVVLQADPEVPACEVSALTAEPPPQSLFLSPHLGRSD